MAETVQESADRAHTVSFRRVTEPKVTTELWLKAQVLQFKQPWSDQISSRGLHTGAFIIVGFLPLLLPNIRTQAMKYHTLRYGTLALAALVLSSTLYSDLYPFFPFNRLTEPQKYFQFFLFFLTVAFAGTAQSINDQFAVRRISPILLLPLLTIVTNSILVGQQPTNTRTPQRLDVPPQLSGLSDIPLNSGRVFTMMKEFSRSQNNYQFLTYNYATLFGYNHFGGYDPLRLQLTNDLTLGLTLENAYKKDLSQSLLRYLSSWNVTHIVSDFDLDITPFPQLQQVSSRDNVRVYHNTSAKPLVYDPAHPEQPITYTQSINKLVIYPSDEKEHEVVVAIAPLPNLQYAINDESMGQIPIDAAPLVLTVPSGTQKLTIEYFDRELVKGTIVSLTFILILSATYLLYLVRQRKYLHSRVG